MTPVHGVTTAAGPSAGASRDDLARLRKTAQQMEGVFVQQLFKAMRETVPHQGVDGTDAGQEMFTALLDEKIATDAPQHWRRGLADSIARQMTHRPPAPGTPGTHVPSDGGNR